MKIREVTAALLGIVVGCTSEPEPVEGNDRDYDGTTQEIIENLREAGYPDTEIEVRDGLVFAGRDALVTLQASREMIGVPIGATRDPLDGSDDSDFRQFRTINLISLDIAVICIDGTEFSGILSRALDDAISNYNELDLTFEMVRTTGSDAGCDAEIIGHIVAGGGGEAGFPAGGLPFEEINIGRGVARNGVAVSTHVITHELGHCIGFRHSDFFNRSISCGVGGNEGRAPDGAILIPGTPARAVVNGSVMNSCFDVDSTGVFTATDLIALDALYGDQGDGGASSSGDGG